MKIALTAVLSAAILILIAACIEPADLDKFLKNDAVQDKLIRTRVTLVDNSGDNLKAGNAKITGLLADKYYMTEVWTRDEITAKSELKYDAIYFIGAGGQLVPSDTPQEISMPSAKEIKDLTNGYTYKVFSSAALTVEMTLYEQNDIPSASDDPPSTGKKVTPADKELKLGQTEKNYYLELPATFKKTGCEFTIIKAPIPKDANNPPEEITISGSIITLNNEESTTDYLIIQTKEDKGNIIIESFHVLRVVIGDATVPAFDCACCEDTNTCIPANCTNAADCCSDCEGTCANCQQIPVTCDCCEDDCICDPEGCGTNCDPECECDCDGCQQIPVTCECCDDDCICDPDDCGIDSDPECECDCDDCNPI